MSASERREERDAAAAGPETLAAAFAGALGSFPLDVAFEVPMRGVTGLFGPSGCGKTTILRCVAGLQRLAGRLCVGGDAWQDDATGTFRRPHERPVGYVFQEASLFPHLSVGGNLRYGARRVGGGALDPAPLAFDDVVELLGVGPLLERAPQALSGGERQRVAIGRALLSRPRLLLMDEPLAGLDRAAKAEILPYLEALHESLRIPILYVSHDLEEVERLADTLLLLDRGRVQACGPLAALEADPALSLLQEPEAAVMLEGCVERFDEHHVLTTLSIPGGTLIVPGRQGSPGRPRRLRIRASDVSFSRTRPVDTTILNSLPARIVSVSRQGADDAQENLVVGLGEDGSGARIVGRVTRRSREALALAPGGAVFVQIKSVALVGR